MQQKELAALLGISPAMVSRLKKMNMPTDSVERAQRWRRRHLEPGRMKGSRFDPTQPIKPIGHAVLPSNGVPPGISLVDIEADGVGLDTMLKEHDSDWAQLMVQQFRSKLRQLPDDAKPRLALRVWIALRDYALNLDGLLARASIRDELLTPGQFVQRLECPPSECELLLLACDRNDYAINGWPEYPDEVDEGAP